MDRLTEIPVNSRKAKKLFTFLMLLFCFLPILINSVIISPIYTVMNADVAFPDWALTVVDLLMDMLDVVGFSVPYAIIIFSALLIGRRTAKYIAVLYTLFFFVQIPVKIFMNIPVNGSLGSADQIITDVIYLAVYFLLFMLQLLVVYTFAATDSNKYMRHVEMSKAKKEKRNKGKASTVPDTSSYVLPLTKLYSHRNPLQRSAFKMGLLILAVKVFARLLNDVTYGLPESFGEVLVMAVYYLSDVIYGLVAYFIALVAFYFIYEKLKDDKKADEAEAPSADDIL